MKNMYSFQKQFAYSLFFESYYVYTYFLMQNVLLLFFDWQTKCLIWLQKYKKSVIQYSIITDFLLIYNLIPLLYFIISIFKTSINSFFLRLAQLACKTTSILKSNFPSVSCLREQTTPNSLVLPLVETLFLVLNEILGTHTDRQTETSVL